LLLAAHLILVCPCHRRRPFTSLHYSSETKDECDEEDGEPGVERGSDLGCHGRVSTHQASEHRSIHHLHNCHSSSIHRLGFLHVQEVFDKDTFSKDDLMGDAEFDIEALVQIIQMDLEDIRSGTVVRSVRPGGKDSCLADESHIIWDNGQVVQDLLLKLRNVDTGVVHLQLKWVTIPGSKLIKHDCMQL